MRADGCSELPPWEQTGSRPETLRITLSRGFTSMACVTAETSASKEGKLARQFVCCRLEPHSSRKSWSGKEASARRHQRVKRNAVHGATYDVVAEAGEKTGLGSNRSPSLPRRNLRRLAMKLVKRPG